MLEFLIELFAELFIEGLLDGLWAEWSESHGREKHHPAAAAFGYLILGAFLGGLSVWLLPQRILSPVPIEGLSLLVNPLVAGLAMEFWGRYRSARGHAITNLATWFGGAALALGISLVRFLGVS